MAQRFIGKDPRNDDDYASKLRNMDDYDDWEFGLEPIPLDHSWTKEKAPEGPVNQTEVTKR